MCQRQPVRECDVCADGSKPESPFDIPVTEEAFMFSQDHFYGGSAWLDGKENFDKMKSELTRRYREPSFVNSSISLWKWLDGPNEATFSCQARFARNTVTFEDDKS